MTIRAFATGFYPYYDFRMTDKEVEAAIAAMNKRLDAHSLYIINEVMPAIEKARAELARIWVSNDRFTELERAVADIAMVVYDRKSRKRADSRVRPH